jgi:hypothetical protein
VHIPWPPMINCSRVPLPKRDATNIHFVEWHLLGCYAMWLFQEPTFWRNLRPPSFLRSVRRLLVTANVPSSPILVTLMMETPSSSETSVLKRATLPKIPEDAILHSHRRESLKPYILCMHQPSVTQKFKLYVGLDLYFSLPETTSNSKLGY